MRQSEADGCRRPGAALLHPRLASRQHCCPHQQTGEAPGLIAARFLPRDRAAQGFVAPQP